MKTPITDAKIKAGFTADERRGQEVPADLARRLELDRAALMEFLAKLETMANDDEYGSSDFRKVCRYDIPKVMFAARANFPTE
jgi:hypothetical protein